MFDFAIFVLVDSPPRTRRPQPAVLVGSTVEIAINVSIDFDTILVVAPLVHLAIAIDVGETPQRLPIRIVNDETFKSSSSFVFACA